MSFDWEGEKGGEVEGVPSPSGWRSARSGPLARLGGRGPATKKALGTIQAAMVPVLTSPLLPHAVGGPHGHWGSRDQPEAREHREVRGHWGVHEQHEFFEHRGFRQHHGTEEVIGSGLWWDRVYP